MDEYTTKCTGKELAERLSVLTTEDWQAVIDGVNTVPISDRNQRRWEGFEYLLLAAEYHHFK